MKSMSQMSPKEGLLYRHIRNGRIIYNHWRNCYYYLDTFEDLQAEDEVIVREWADQDLVTLGAGYAVKFSTE